MSLSAETPLQLRPDLEEFGRLIAYVAEFAERHELSPGDQYALDLAAEELFANTVRHSAHAATLVEFLLTREEDGIHVVYEDDGLPFDPTQQNAPDTNLSAEDRAIGGLGIHLIRKSMRDFAYRREGNRNRITFTRKSAH